MQDNSDSEFVLPENGSKQGQNLALTVQSVPDSIDSGDGRAAVSRAATGIVNSGKTPRTVWGVITFNSDS